MATPAAVLNEPVPSAEYSRLEERILARDQRGASDVLYRLLKRGRPVTEITRETVRIHAPYTHVPYHQRLDDGVVKFVNNDHCLLSERVGLPLASMIRPALRLLPLAQTVWYIPTGLDPWNQLLGKAPGHYTRLYDIKVNQAPPMPEAHWPDQEPLPIEGSLAERLNHWLTLVQRGEVLTSYRVFLGLMQDGPNRRQVLGHLAFAGLIDVQDRMFHNRSYTTGHKAYRARATIELGEALGWDAAHSVLYAGVPDMAVGPRWYSTYETGCNIIQNLLDGRDAELLRQQTPLTPAEEAMLVDAITRQREVSVIEALVALLRAGRDPRRILDAIQIAAAQVILETGLPNNFSMAQHGYEYCNTLGWFYDTFEHPHRLKLLFVAALFINRGAEHQANTPGNGRRLIAPLPGAESWSARQLLERLDQALLALRPEEAVDLTAAYLKGGFDRPPLVEELATAACKLGNDPHNQELGLCLLEDYLNTKACDRDRLLLASAQHTAGHRKYGDPLEAYRRFAEAFDLDGR
ncbi:MAG TPA: hypothetical protein VLG10_05420 [Methylomirabilota bacterium]|nr:hypothetical protein [Methylomirabilota bacterium]